MEPWEMAEIHYAELERQLRRRPVCCECGGHIQEEYCYEVNGEYVCEDCMETFYRVRVEDICE